MRRFKAAAKRNAMHWLSQGTSPRRLALTLALGFAIGCIPVVGIPTVLCATVALALRLNLPAIQAANYVRHASATRPHRAFHALGRWLVSADTGRLTVPRSLLHFPTLDSLRAMGSLAGQALAGMAAGRNSCGSLDDRNPHPDVAPHPMPLPPPKPATSSGEHQFAAREPRMAILPHCIRRLTYLAVLLFPSVWVRHRLGAIDPRRIDHVAQHAGSRSYPLGGKVARFGRPRAHESSGLLELVHLLDVSARMPQVRHIGVEHVAVDHFHRRHLGLHVRRMDVRRDKWALKLLVNLMVRGIAVRIGTSPAVVLHGHMQWLRAVTNIVSQPACVKDDCRLDWLRVPACSQIER